MAEEKKKRNLIPVTLQQVYQLPSSKVTLYAELLAGKTLFRLCLFVVDRLI